MKVRFRVATLLAVAALSSLALSSAAVASVTIAADYSAAAAPAAPIAPAAYTAPTTYTAPTATTTAEVGLIVAASEQPNWQWPVQSPWEIRREFVAPESQYGAGHRGVDLGVGAGDEIVSPADGTVFFAGVVVDRPVISIRHADGLVSSFEPVASDLVAGHEVVQGDQIGRVASGGHCAGSCVHFGVRLHGHYISPRLPLGVLPRAVLLPVSGG